MKRFSIVSFLLIAVFIMPTFAQEEEAEWSFIDQEDAPVEDVGEVSNEVKPSGKLAFLNLTPEQKPKVQEITQSFLQESKSKRKLIKKKKAEIRAMKGVKGRKRKVLNKKKKEVRALVRDLNKSFKVKEQLIFQILTPEQKRLWNQKKKKKVNAYKKGKKKRKKGRRHTRKIELNEN